MGILLIVGITTNTQIIVEEFFGMYGEYLGAASLRRRRESQTRNHVLDRTQYSTICRLIVGTNSTVQPDQRGWLGG